MLTNGSRELEGKVALVTGGGRGVGKAICKSLASHGCSIALTYVRNASDALATVEEIEAAGGVAFCYQSSIESPEDNQTLVKNVIQKQGRIDILVNNGGVASKGLSVEDTSYAESERLLKVHAIGPQDLCARALPYIRQQARGDIIFISSIAAITLGRNGAPYNMGKAAMEALAQTLAREELEDGIHVNIVRPGLVETDMGVRLARARGAESIRELDATMPFGRVCQPVDVADAVLFLVSEGSRYLTGQTIEVSGGQEWK